MQEYKWNRLLQRAIVLEEVKIEGWQMSFYASKWDKNVLAQLCKGVTGLEISSRMLERQLKEDNLRASRSGTCYSLKLITVGYEEDEQIIIETG